MNSKFLHTITRLFFDGFICIKIRYILEYFWLNMRKVWFFNRSIWSRLMCKSWFLKSFWLFLIRFLILNRFRIKLIRSKNCWFLYYFLNRFWIKWNFRACILLFDFYFLAANFSTQRLAGRFSMSAIVERWHTRSFSL
jgi:hypothetical protein